ncbi:MAG TPA: tetratricopeptide repeat protein [Candidatus Coprenecus stercoravium]|uniref:Tetratricopeptide repeat protein n=1 Tax=Candidatus Coprenecus stercoravium TaxID=2840735 RepID=A0A9D2GPZ2_9BACT|nr:tetratricopeptide repeat protein [Candidatus Coprenecus stercoravium]
MRRFILSLAVLFFSIRLLSAGEVDSLWNSSVQAYTEQDYQTALNGFSAIEDLGYESAALYYNIADCYYKLGNYVGKSILYYERALKLDPSFEDAEVNLEIARELAVDRIETVPEFILLTWLKAVRDIMPSDAWAWTALALFLVTAVMVLIFRFAASLALRKTAFGMGVVSLILTIVALISAFSLAHSMDNRAVVTVPVSSVKSSPGSTDQSLFILHEGTGVEVLDRLGEWTRIELSDGRQGWMESKGLEII